MIKLLLPVLFPSWRFFSSIGPSPRIDVGFIAQENAEPQEWILYYALPKKISFSLHLVKLFYNPEWNLQLYLNTCAERLCDAYSVFYEQEIERQLLAAIAKGKIKIPDNNTHIQFRIRTLEYEHQQDQANEALQEKIVFVSKAISL